MVIARIGVVMVLSLTGLLLTSVPGYSQSVPAQPGSECGNRPEEPVPPAPGAPGRQDPGSRPSDCSRGQGDESDSDVPSEEESEMKSSEGGFTAATVALLATLASGPAGAAGEQQSLSVTHCRVESSRSDTEACFTRGGQEECHTVATGSAGGLVCRIVSVATDSGGDGSGGVTPSTIPCSDGKVGTGIDAKGSGTLSLKVAVYHNANPVPQIVFEETKQFSDADLWANPLGPQLPAGLCVQPPIGF